MRFSCRLPLLFVLGCAALHAAPIDPATGQVQPVVPEIAAAGYQLAFSDEFNGSQLDSGKWAYRTDSKMLSTQLPANVSVSDGVLHLALRKESARGKDHTGGGVISHDAFRYGYYEARFRVPAGAGWHTSFWLQKQDGSGSTGTKVAAQEIDICEQTSPKPEYSAGVIDWARPDHPKGLDFGRKYIPATGPARGVSCLELRVHADGGEILSRRQALARGRCHAVQASRHQHLAHRHRHHPGRRQPFAGHG